MYDLVGQSGQTAQAVRLVKIGDDGRGTGSTEFSSARWLASNGKDAETLTQQW